MSKQELELLSQPWTLLGGKSNPTYLKAELKHIQQQLDALNAEKVLIEMEIAQITTVKL